MTQSIVATVKIKPGMSAAFKAQAMQLVAAVNSDEPGCLLYTLNQHDEHTFVFIERYADAAAIDAHRNSVHYKTMGAGLGALMDGAPQVWVMNELS
jgi:quinol monooxygenase YgiN